LIRRIDREERNKTGFLLDAQQYRGTGKEVNHADVEGR
jgi:hypothetical protein